MKTESRRDLRTLEAIAENDQITQRNLSTKLGIALGLTNLYLKRLVRKGFVKCISLRSNRIRYLLTPSGIAEKTRLVYEFMDYSLSLYSQVRMHLRLVLEPLARGAHRHVAIYGSGEAAELAYMSILELGLDVSAVFDDDAEGRFLGQPVLDVRNHHSRPFDLLIVATLDRPGPIIEELVGLGLPRQKLVALGDDRRTAPLSPRQGCQRKKSASSHAPAPLAQRLPPSSLATSSVAPQQPRSEVRGKE